MNTLVEKLVQINGFDLDSTEIKDVVQSIDSNGLSLINNTVNFLIQEQKGGDLVSQSLSQLDLRRKFYLLALLVNKSNDLLLYPADLREKQMQVWANDLNVSQDLIRAVMIVGGEKILNKLED